MGQSNIVAGGCVQTPAPSDGDGLSGALGAIGGLAQAAMSGNLMATLKNMAIEKGKQLLTGLLTKLFTLPVAPKPPKPPWTAMGKVAPPGSAFAAAAIAAYNSVHSAPTVPTASAGGSAGGPGGGGPGGAPGGSTTSPPATAANDPWSLSGILGKLWALPNTILGLGLGIIGMPIGALFRIIGLQDGWPWFSLGENTIQFTNNPMAWLSAWTFGNIAIFGPNVQPDDPRAEGPGTVGDHEDQHSYQAEQLGPFYLISNILGGLWALMNDPGWDWHGPSNWNERGPQSHIPVPWRDRDLFDAERNKRIRFCKIDRKYRPEYCEQLH